MAVNFLNSTRTAVTVAATGNTATSTTMAQCVEYDIYISNGGAAALYVLGGSTDTTSPITVAAGDKFVLRGVKHGEFPYLRSASGNLSIIYRVIGHQAVVTRQFPENRPFIQRIVA